MRLSPIHPQYRNVRSARIALAAAAVAGLVVVAACTDYGDKSVTGPRSGPRSSSASSGGFGNAGHVDLCVDKSSPVGDYTFAYSDQNNQEALAGNRFFDSGIWTDEGGDFHAFPPFGNTGPTNMPDGSVTVFTPANVIHNDGITTACLRPLDRTQGSTAFETGQSLVDTWSAMTIEATSNNANAVYSHTDCLVDVGTLVPEHTIPNPLSIPLWSAATVFAAGALTRTDEFPAIPNHGDRIWRAKVGNTNVAPTEGATWSTADLGPCDTGNNPTRAFANVEHGIVVTFVFTAPAGHNCTYTQGYYKNHESYTASVLSGNAGTTYIDGTGKLIIGSYHLTAAQVDDILGAAVGHGYNAGGVTFTKDQLSMIHQLITAELNVAGGAAPATIAATITAANSYIGATKTQLSAWTDALDDFNKGSNGPAHCS